MRRSFNYSVMEESPLDSVMEESSMDSVMKQSPIITVKQGQLQGRIKNDRVIGQYFSFQGIPYAKPPIGNLRFKAPQPVEPWQGVKDASREGDVCFQMHIILKTMIGSEDCLFLNIYTPELPSTTSTLKPVMVWIHGGAFISGSGNQDVYGPQFLLSQDVVVVTLNYRLGLLGFLNFEDSSIGVPGNAGLKDQVMALKWIEQNISSFNGNPNNVTIFGESSGAASVHSLVLSPMAKGLFHKAIIQSATATAVWVLGQRSTPMLAEALGLKTATEQEIYAIVKDMPVGELFKLQMSVPDIFLASFKRLIGTVVEKNSYEPAFFPEHPIDIMSSGNYSHVPMIFGYCSREGILAEIFANIKSEEFIPERDFKLHVPHTLHVQDPKKIEEIGNQIHEFYFANKKPTLKNIDQYFVMDTDNFFVRSIIRSIKSHLNTSSQPIYLYKFSLDSSLNLFKKLFKIQNRGVAHGDDLGYLFKNLCTPKLRPGSIEDNAMNRMLTLWRNFANNGNPNPREKDPLINVIWKPTEKDMLHFLEINENLTTGVNPELSRMNFWDGIFGPVESTSKL